MVSICNSIYDINVEWVMGMKINSIILDAIKKNNNIITTEQVVKLGFSRYLLSKYEKEGLLDRERQGVYILPDAVHDDMYTLMLRSNKIVFSHDSALFLNGLSDRTPFVHSVTISNNTRVSKVVREECVCYYVKPELYELGMTVRKTTFGNEVRCYDAERTICDLLRSRNRIDEEMVISAVKNYAASSTKNLNVLGEYASKFGVDKTLKRYLEVLL